MTNISKIIGKTIKMARIEKDLSQQDLAKKMKTSQGQIHKWEAINGDKISIQRIALLCNAMDLPVSKFLKKIIHEIEKDKSI